MDDCKGKEALSKGVSLPELTPFIVTAYCPGPCCCGEFADGYTAAGHKIRPGDRIVAAPPEIPFWTIIDIPGYGRAVVLDRGGAIKNNKLDVLFHSHEEAVQWGRQELEVRILEK